MRGVLVALAAAALVLSAAVPAAAGDLPGDVCPCRYEAAAGPLPGGTQAEQPADFGAIPEACAGSDLSLRLRGELAVHSGAPDFSGDIVAGVTLAGRRRLNGRTWISLSVDVLTYRYFNNGGLVGTGTSFGPAALGLHRVLLATPRTVLAGYARALLPIDTARPNGLETGLELGAAARARPSRRWALDGGLSLAGPLIVTEGVAHGRLEPAALAEAWFSPKTSFALFGGGSVRVEAAPVYALVAVTPRLGLRAALRHGLWLAFAAEAPLGGTDPTQAVASLFVGWIP